MNMMIHIIKLKVRVTIQKG